MPKKKNTKDAKTVTEAFEEFLEAKLADGIRLKTTETYRHMFHSFMRYMDDIQITDLTDQFVKEAINRLARTGVSPNTVRSHTATLKTFFTWCRYEGLCDVKIKLYKGVETVPDNIPRKSWRPC